MNRVHHSGNLGWSNLLTVPAFVSDVRVIHHRRVHEYAEDLPSGGSSCACAVLCRVVATAVFFHAHPDDEAIATGGTMAKMADEGHRIVLVFATAGEEGEVAAGLLEDGETLGVRRRAEALAAAEILGVARTVFLGYRDSGMMGAESNGKRGVFWQADVEEAAGRLAALLQRESADVLTVYDAHGGYGHPDHIQVHRVGHRAAALAGTGRVFESTINRDLVKRFRSRMPEEDAPSAASEAGEGWMDRIGLPESEITAVLDVGRLLDRKRRAMLAHASQIPPDSWFFSMGEDAFAAMWGREWFRQVTPRPGARPSGHMETSLL